MLSLDLLKTFVQVSWCKNYTKAGARVHLTQSAVSMQMKRLQDLVGAPLFAKDGGRFHLTQHGEILLDYADRLLQLHDQALTDLARPQLSGRLRFGAPEDYASWFLPRVLARFASVYPQIRVDMRIGASEDLKAALDTGELDLILCTEITQGGQIVYRSPVVWVGPLKWRFSENEPYPLAVYPEGCVFRKWATEALSALGRPYRIAYTSPSVSAIMAAVRAGLAIAPVSSMNAGPDVALLGNGRGFPVLPVASISLHKSTENGPEALDRLAGFITDAFREISGSAGLGCTQKKQ